MVQVELPLKNILVRINIGMSDEAKVKAIVEDAQSKSKCLGLMKWCYYMTLGWVLSPKHAQVNWQLTKAVWNAL